MPFSTTLYIFVVLVVGFNGNVRAVYEQNPFLQGGKIAKNLTKELNQFNLAIIVPPGQEPYLTQAGAKPPSPPAPGYVWVQVPLSNTPINDNKPSTAKPLPPLVTQAPVTQQPQNAVYTETLPQQTTKEPLFTIEPPSILYGNDLNKKCLKPRGQFPSDSCNTYVNCWDGVAVEQSCPGGFLFNPVKLYCDYPVNVNCQGKFLSTTPLSAIAPGYVTSASPTQTVTYSPSVSPGLNPSLRKFCLRSTGLFPGSTCGKFVNCWNDNAVEQDCPEGLYFSSEGYCDYPENVDCGHQKKGTLEKTEVKSSECPLEFGSFRDRSNCSQYYTCAYYKVAAKYVCPEGLSFSDLLGICDYSYRVQCDKEPQIFQKNSANMPGHNFPFNAYAHPELLKPAEVGDSRCIVSYGLVRDKDNCSSYYVCDMGNVVASYMCPQGYKFSNELGVCDIEEKVNCDNPSRAYDLNSGMVAIPNIPNEVLSQVQRCIPGTVFRLNPQCTSACYCRNGLAEIIQCSAGLAYDSQMDKCVPLHLARC